MNRAYLTAEYTFVATLAATLVFGIMRPLIASVSPAGGTAGGVFAWHALVTTGTYFFLFKILLVGYFRIAWKLVHRASYVGGDWEYEFNNSYDKSTKQDTSGNKYGNARIVQEPEFIVLNGESRLGAERESTVIATYQGQGFGVVNDRIELTIDFVGRQGSARGFLIVNVVTHPTVWWRIIPQLPQRIEGFYYLFGSEGVVSSNGRIVFKRIAQ